MAEQGKTNPNPYEKQNYPADETGSMQQDASYSEWVERNYQIAQLLPDDLPDEARTEALSSPDIEVVRRLVDRSQGDATYLHLLLLRERARREMVSAEGSAEKSALEQRLLGIQRDIILKEHELGIS